MALTAAAIPASGAEWIDKQSAGLYFFELRVTLRATVTETPFVVAITRADGKPVETAKARGRANFSSAGLKGVATLHPDGENRMKGQPHVGEAGP